MSDRGTNAPIRHAANVVQDITVITPRFKLIFISVFSLTVILLVANVILVLAIKNPSLEAQNLMDLCSRLTTVGFGAIIGLLGGKAA
jgi:hypothetical protein